jgi:hypothetical protein
MKPRVYIETTIPSYLTARPSEEHIRAARQELTRRWWDTRRHDFELCVAQPVFDECGAGQPDAARLRLDILQDMTVLELSADAKALTKVILAAGIIPAKAATDASHIAIAAANGVPYMLTWNCKHIANAALRPTLERLCMEHGWQLPIICTPEELLEPFP